MVLGALQVALKGQLGQAVELCSEGQQLVEFAGPHWKLLSLQIALVVPENSKFRH